METFYKYADGRRMPYSFTKQVAEVRQIKMDFSNITETGESKVDNQLTVVVYDSNDDDVTTTIQKGSLTKAANTITMQVQAGEDGKKYKITFKYGTDANNLYEQDVYMLVKNV